MASDVENVPPLHPLRVPAGWRIGWNVLLEGDEEPARCGPNPTAVFQASNEHARCVIDVDWVDRADAPLGGAYRLLVVYAPWPRTPAGRRRKGLPLEFDWQNPKHAVTITSKAELVAEIERLFYASFAWTEQN